MKTNFVNPETGKREVGRIDDEYVVNAKGERFHRNTIKKNMEQNRKTNQNNFLSKILNFGK